ncbi:MAG: hypothetical protein HC848_08790 [Limnobacter sp.]|nr:hypothetical protein [Limnobacter sp.]
MHGAAMPCPCGTGIGYAACCKPYHEATATASRVEALMRSRYSAYVLGLKNYLLATWHPGTRPQASDDLGLSESKRWLGLEVRRAFQTGTEGQVEFVARYKPASAPAGRLHETSRFVLENGQWFYVEGV